jgi:hypothetical protein
VREPFFYFFFFFLLSFFSRVPSGGREREKERERKRERERERKRERKRERGRERERAAGKKLTQPHLHKENLEKKSRRELERHPEVFGLPSSPAAFASWSRNLPSLFPVPPAPRTRKLIGMLGVIATAVRREEFLSFLSRRGLGAGGRKLFWKKTHTFLPSPPLVFSLLRNKKTQRSPSSPSGTSPWASRATQRSPRQSAGTF